MDVLDKPSCYDSVPACLCMSCQLYDVRQMVRAKSAVVSSRSPFLPSYAVSLLSRPASKSVVSSVTSTLSTRPSCTTAVTTCGLSSVDDQKPDCFSSIAAPKPVCEPGCFPRCPYLSRPCLDFADSSSSPFFSPSPVAVSPSCPVSSSVWSVAPSSSPVVSVAASTRSSVCSVTASPVRCSPNVVCSVAASTSSPVCSVAASPVRCLPSLVSPVPCHRVFCPSSLLSRPPFVPVARPVWLVAPVLLLTVFGFVLGFLPLLRWV